MNENWRTFFENRKLVRMIDNMAQRYHKLPHEILCDSTLYEFEIDVAIMAAALLEDKKDANPATQQWNKLGIEREVIGGKK
mgnify:CR=1 FL=1